MRKEIRDLLDMDVVTIAEAALLTKLDESTFRKRIARGSLESVKKYKGIHLLDIQDIKMKRKKK